MSIYNRLLISYQNYEQLIAMNPGFRYGFKNGACSLEGINPPDLQAPLTRIIHEGS
jgi:hypothetical protein